MKVTKKYLAYSIVLAIGFGWLGMDCFGTAPIRSAAQAETVIQHQDSSAALTTTAAADMGDEPAIAHRLNELMQQRGLSDTAFADGFSIPAAFHPVVAVKVNHHQKVIDVLSKFRSSHNLMSVMVAGRASNALVDGRLLQIGDHIDGFTLVQVNQNSAVFSNGSNKISLNFKRASEATASLDR